MTTPQTELLGIKDMIEGGTFKSHQFVGQVHHQAMLFDRSDEVQTPPVVETPESSQPVGLPPTVDDAPEPSSSAAEPEKSSLPEASNALEEVESSSASASSSYGPMRRRLDGKGGRIAYRDAPSSHRARVETHEIMSVQDINHLCSLCDDKDTPIEVLIPSYLEKKMSKELPPRKNPPELQQLVDESK